MGYKSRSIGVCVPAYNEASLVRATYEGIPKWIDYIALVDDASTDETYEVMREIAKRDHRVSATQLPTNSGVGGAILSGHQVLLSKGAEIFVVMAGDDQMDPASLPMLLDPIIEDRSDYVKGNRFSSFASVRSMPKIRVFGNLVLSFLSKFATGLWHISDPQNGYTAIKVSLYKDLPVARISQRFDFENDMLCWCRILEARVLDVPIPARYKDEKSKLRIISTAIVVFRTLVTSFMRRIWWNYLLWASSPAGLFLVLSSLFLTTSLGTGIWLTAVALGGSTPSPATSLIPVGAGLIGLIFGLTFIVLDVVSCPKPTSRKYE